MAESSVWVVRDPSGKAIGAGVERRVDREGMLFGDGPFAALSNAFGEYSTLEACKILARDVENSDSDCYEAHGYTLTREALATPTPHAGEPVALCEAGCGPATTSDSDGIPLCAECAASLDRETLHEIAALVGYEHGDGDLVDVVRAKLAPAPEAQPVAWPHVAVPPATWRAITTDPAGAAASDYWTVTPLYEHPPAPAPSTPAPSAVTAADWWPRVSSLIDSVCIGYATAPNADARMERLDRHKQKIRTALTAALAADAGEG